MTEPPTAAPREGVPTAVAAIVGLALPLVATLAMCAALIIAVPVLLIPAILLGPAGMVLAGAGSALVATFLTLFVAFVIGGMGRGLRGAIASTAGALVPCLAAAWWLRPQGELAVGAALLVPVLWLVAGLLGVRKRGALRSRAVCPKCGYSLEGLETPGCPECGWGRDSAIGA